MFRRSCIALTAVALLVSNAHAFHAFSSLCLSTPSLPLVAGVSNISAVYDVSYWQQCRAFLSFAAQDFPTVTFNFGPKYCKGREVASFLVPAEVPNGEAHLIWECSDLPPTCVQALITQGKGNSSMSLDQIGSLRCEPVSRPSNTSELSCASAASTSSIISMVTITDAEPGMSLATSSSAALDVTPVASVASNGFSSSDDHTTWHSSSTKDDAAPTASTDQGSADNSADSSNLSTTNAPTALSQESAVTRTSSTEQDSSNRDGIAGFPSVNSAARLTIPGLSFTVFTLTQTVTTLLTATTSLAGV